MPGRYASLLAIGGLSKPEVPPYVPVDPAKEQAKTIQGNFQIAPEAFRLGEMTTTQLKAMLDSVLPGASQQRAQIGETLNQQLRGEIPKDVVQRVQDAAAARAIGGGYAGSGSHGNLVARDLGLTSLQITQQAMDSAARWQALGNQLASYGFGTALNMFLTPQQRIEYSFRNTENKWNRDWLAEQVKAMPSPMQQAMMMDIQEQFRDTEQFFMNFYGGKGGGMGGGK